MKTMGKISLVAVCLASLCLTACKLGPGLNNADRVTGTVTAPNGDVLAGATVYIPSDQTALLSKFTVRTKLLAITAGDSTSCDDPDVASCASACTGADGSFELDTSGCTDEKKLFAKKGAFKTEARLKCRSNDCTADISFDHDNTIYPKVAVVTGSFDAMEGVLAKIAPGSTGYGTLDEYGEFQEPSSNLVRINGTGYDNEFTSFETYLNGTNSLSEFSIVFINCGADYELEEMLYEQTTRDILKNYVAQGGTLYVTDQAYDFINQPFPAFMNFVGDTDNTSLLNDAEMGTDGLTVNAAVSDETMKAWLKNVAVIRHDLNTPGLPDTDCNYDVTALRTRIGALNPDDTLPVGDFLSSWAQMHSVNTGTDTKVWISSGSTNFDGQVDRPLTVSGTYGLGRIFYSSYHTAHTCPSPYFWPQERVLQYLIFEAF